MFRDDSSTCCRICTTQEDGSAAGCKLEHRRPFVLIHSSIRAARDRPYALNDACSLASVGIVMADTRTRRGRHHPPRDECLDECLYCSGLEQAPIAAKSALVLARINPSSYYSYKSPLEDILPQTHWPALLLVVLLGLVLWYKNMNMPVQEGMDGADWTGSCCWQLEKASHPIHWPAPLRNRKRGARAAYVWIQHTTRIYLALLT